MRIFRFVQAAAGVALTLVLATASPVLAAAPVTVLDLDPPIADGAGGWYCTPPEAFATVDQGATLFYRFGTDPESSVVVSPGIPRSLGFFPEGITLLAAHSANSAEETEAPGPAVLAKVDSLEPSEPTALAAEDVPGGGIRLTWTAGLDAGSGVAGYVVYRYAWNDLSEPVEIGRPTDTTFTDDPPPYEETYPPYTYYVATRDVAGNLSLFSEGASVVPRTAAVSIARSAQAVTYGSYVRFTVRSRLQAGPDSWPDGGATVLLQRYVPGHGWTTVGTQLTDGTGTAVFSAKPLSTGSYRAMRAAGEYAPEASSDTTSVFVRLRVTASTSRSRLRRGRTLTFSGATAPSPVTKRHTVRIQRRTSKGWVTVARTTTTSWGSYRCRFKAWSRGRVAYRALLITPSAKYWSGVSATRYVTWY